MLHYSFLDESSLRAAHLDTEPISKMFDLPGDERRKPRDLGCPYKRPAMKPHWGREMSQGIYSIGGGYPVRPTKACNDLAASRFALRPLNPNRWALDTCEPWCGPDVCREYGNQLEAYFDCLRCGRKDCKRPRNPRDCGCRSPLGGADFQGCTQCLYKR
jgi:hypothetical protein